MEKTSKKFVTVAAVIAVAAVVILIFVGWNSQLVLSDRHTGEVYAKYPISDGDRFSVEFIHSVNKTPVCDIYEVRDGNDIYVVETDYYDFNAGVQTELNVGETLTYGDDGAMIISGIDDMLPNLTYVVGTVSDHVLRIGDEEISLRDLCGKNSSVTFSVERRGF